MSFQGPFLFIDNFVAAERKPKLKGAGGDRVGDEFSHVIIFRF
jgi:hypothetical protein